MITEPKDYPEIERTVQKNRDSNSTATVPNASGDGPAQTSDIGLTNASLQTSSGDLSPIQSASSLQSQTLISDDYPVPPTYEEATGQPTVPVSSLSVENKNLAIPVQATEAKIDMDFEFEAY